jgi:hypothetical protein
MLVLVYRLIVRLHIDVSGCEDIMRSSFVNMDFEKLASVTLTTESGRADGRMVWRRGSRLQINRNHQQF